MDKFRLIQYIPEHSRGTRFTIAAAVLQSGHFTLLECDRLPGSSCLGSERSAHALLMACESLRSMSDFEQLPVSVGSHVQMDSACEVPATASDAIAWVRKHVLATEVVPSSSGRLPSQHRSTFGFSFFRRLGVHTEIKKTFDPMTDARGWLAGAGSALSPITHWVMGRNRLLLMEPIIPSRPQLDRDLKSIGQQFLAYRWAIEKCNGAAVSASIIAYVLRGGSEEARRHAMAQLATPAHRVLDVSIDGVAEALGKEVREVAATLGGQTQLDKN